MAGFPADFQFGATLSAHQAEGGNYANDWWRWEQRPGRIADGSTSQVAAGHYGRYREDMALAAKFKHRAMLVSLDWSRVEPAEARYEPAALEHYRAVFETLRKHGIEPVCALNEVALPQWFADSYGWAHPQAPALFAHYAGAVAETVGHLCRRWIPIFEPVNYITLALLEGLWPPGLHSLRQARNALTNLGRAHLEARAAVIRTNPAAEVGVAVRARVFQPDDPRSPWDLRAARHQSRLRSHLFLRSLMRAAPDGEPPCAFIGVSYYGRERLRFSPFRPFHLFSERLTETGATARLASFEPWPEGLREVLREFAPYGRPLLVTGNGVAASDDRLRCRFLVEHARVLGQCLEEGLPVTGYFHRSLLDQFEWTEGYGPRYGLFHVDRESLARTPNGSAFLFRDLCENGRFQPHTLAQFYPEGLETLERQA